MTTTTSEIKQGWAASRQRVFGPLGFQNFDCDTATVKAHWLPEPVAEALRQDAADAQVADSESKSNTLRDL